MRDLIALVKRVFIRRDGTTALEFALVSPIFLAIVFGSIEYGRVMWANQAVEEVAYVSARCSMTGAATCLSADGVEQFAIAEAERRGLSGLARSDVTAALNVLCNGYDATRVDIIYQVNSPLGNLLPIPEAIETRACFPSAS